ncbi:hypothetical protein FSST1_011495 [Fusarium sambucinum]
MARSNINQHCCRGLTPLMQSAFYGYERQTARLLESEECRMNLNHMADLAGWYRGLKGYVIDGGWDYLRDVLKDEDDETNEKIGRAAVVRGETITDPEMEEFF